MPLSPTGHSSLSSPLRCTGINELWVKQGTQKNKRDSESGREIGSLAGGYFSTAKDQYEQECSMSCVDNGEQKERDLKITSFICSISNTLLTNHFAWIKNQRKIICSGFFIFISFDGTRSEEGTYYSPKCCAVAA